MQQSEESLTLTQLRASLEAEERALLARAQTHARDPVETLYHFTEEERTMMNLIWPRVHEPGGVCGDAVDATAGHNQESAHPGPPRAV